MELSLQLGIGAIITIALICTYRSKLIRLENRVNGGLSVFDIVCITIPLLLFVIFPDLVPVTTATWFVIFAFVIVPHMVSHHLQHCKKAFKDVDLRNIKCKMATHCSCVLTIQLTVWSVSRLTSGLPIFTI